MAQTEAQQAALARTKARELEVMIRLKQLDSIFEKVFNDRSIAIAEPVSQEELEKLIKEVQKSTVHNEKVTRFLQIIEKLGI